MQTTSGGWYVDRAGKIVIPPKFDEAWVFTDGLAGVVVDQQIGYIDGTGEFVWGPRG